MTVAFGAAANLVAAVAYMNDAMAGSHRLADGLMTVTLASNAAVVLLALAAATYRSTTRERLSALDLRILEDD